MDTDQSEINKDEKKEELKKTRIEAILKAARQVFSKKGYYETKVEEIAEIAGVAKGTVYIYFKSKEILFISLIEWLIDNFVREIEKDTKNLKSVPEKIKQYIETSFKNFENNKRFMGIAVFERPSFITKHKKKFKDLFQSRSMIIEKFIREGIKEGIFWPVDPRIAAKGISGTIHHLAMDMFFSPEEYSMNKAKDISNIFLNGLLKRER